jgi:hypothetical protein
MKRKTTKNVVLKRNGKRKEKVNPKESKTVYNRIKYFFFQIGLS